MVRERHRLAGCHPAAYHASDKPEQERRQGTERSIAGHDGRRLGGGNDRGRYPDRSAGQAVRPDSEIAGRAERGQDEEHRHGKNPRDGCVQHGPLRQTVSENLAGRPASNHGGEKRAADTEDQRPHLELVPADDAGFLISAEGDAHQPEDQADREHGERADPDGGPIHQPGGRVPPLNHYR